MRWIKIIIPCVIFFAIGYIFRLCETIGAVKVSHAPITIGDFYANLIGTFSAFGTICAVIVALFLEEIRALFKKVSFKIELANEEVAEDLENFQKTKKAIRYHNEVHIANIGNINARNCELYIENANFSSESSLNTISVENTPIKWNKDSDSVYIPNLGKKVLRIFEFIAPQQQATPEGDNGEIPAKFKILGLPDTDAINSQCQWEITYCLNSINSKPLKFKFTINWNGKWEDRQKEMVKNLTMNLEVL